MKRKEREGISYPNQCLIYKITRTPKLHKTSAAADDDDYDNDDDYYDDDNSQ